MKTQEYITRDATALAELVASGEVTPSELLECAIEQIEKHNPALNAVIYTDFDAARDEAAKARKDVPFPGIPFLLKDLGAGNRRGDPLHMGTRLLRDANFRAKTTSYLVEDFERAGLLPIGRTNVPELGAWASTEPEAYGPTRNPWNRDHSSGGSSGGAATAVAAGFVPLAHASDGGGSIRNPASQCGLIGLKPSRGRLSLGPDIGEGWAGLINEFAVTRSVRDTARLLDAVEGTRPGDPYHSAAPSRPYAQEVGADPGALRIGILTEAPDLAVHPDCVAAALSASRQLEALGHHVENSFPKALVSETNLSEAVIKVVASCQARSVEQIEEILGRKVTSGDMDPDNELVTSLGQGITATAYLAAVESLHAFQREMAQWWAGGFDLLITPTLTDTPPRVGDFTPDPEKPLDAFMRSGNLLRFTIPFNVTGQPAISLPLSHSATGLPVGVQLVADAAREDLLLRVAAQLEPEDGWPCPAP